MKNENILRPHLPLKVSNSVSRNPCFNSNPHHYYHHPHLYHDYRDHYYYYYYHQAYSKNKNVGEGKAEGKKGPVRFCVMFIVLTANLYISLLGKAYNTYVGDIKLTLIMLKL